jgi:hypothetical protein
MGQIFQKAYETCRDESRGAIADVWNNEVM